MTQPLSNGHALHVYASEKVLSTRVARFKSDRGSPIVKGRLLAMSFYRSGTDPQKVLIGNLIGENKSKVSMFDQNAFDCGAIFNSDANPLLTLTIAEAVELFQPSDGSQAQAHNMFEEAKKLCATVDDVAVLQQLVSKP